MPTHRQRRLGLTARFIQAKTQTVSTHHSVIHRCAILKAYRANLRRIRRSRRSMRAEKAQNYLLISNRKPSGIAEQRLTKLISDMTGMPIGNVCACRNSQLDDWLEFFPMRSLDIDQPPPSTIDCHPTTWLTRLRGFGKPSWLQHPTKTGARLPRAHRFRRKTVSTT